MRRLLAAVAIAAVALVAGAALAGAELSVSGNLFVTFEGGIFPGALPRHALAPVTVRIAGRVRTLSGEQPPSISGITIALNRNGHLDTHGLRTCRKSEIETSSSAKALAACGPALVGSGRYSARSTFPEQARSPTQGKILAFNATSYGHPIILAQVYGTEPVPSTNVIIFRIRHSSGTYGTILSASPPAGLSRWGYLKRISLSLHRTYTYRGRVHSYLSASCPAPRGLSKASFSFAYASMTFTDSRMLSAKMTRTCTVKGEP
jgi:hypothetical protein